MNANTISRENESLLRFLFATERSAHHLHIIESACPEIHLDEVLLELVTQGYLYTVDNRVELTDAGIRLVHEVNAQSQNAIPSVKPSDFRDNRPQVDLPSANAHPLRQCHARPRNPRSPERRTVNYLLAFETTEYALPIPVLDGDTLGRFSDSSIALSHDEFITGSHCSFRIESNKGQPTLYIQDLASRNGTYLNEIRLEPCEWVLVKAGSRIRVGTTVLIVTQIPR